MVRVGVIGAAGRMGQEVCRAVLGAPDMELACAVDVRMAGIDLRQVVGVDVNALQVSSHIEELAERGVDVAVDFTDAATARATLSWCAANGVHAVVGTSGLGPEDREKAAAEFAESSANALIAANFAIGAVLLMRFCELAAPFMEGVEVIELHHDAKRDAPSGTAMRTAERIGAARAAAGAAPLPPDPTTDLVADGARGAVGAGGVHIHSVRLPGLIAHEEVVFGSLGQSLTIRHDSYDRTSFMAGVLLAVREVGGRPGLTIGLDPLLGF
jgi:4-hydroxy-tetrahydrodipicolinate reductase